MSFKHLLAACCLAAAAAFGGTAGAQTAAIATANDDTVDARVIVRFKAAANTLRQHTMAQGMAGRASFADRATVADISQRRAAFFAKHVGAALGGGRMLDERTQVIMALPGGARLDSATLARRLAQHPDVDRVMVDRRRSFHAVPNDPLFAAGPPSGLGPDVGQWYLRANTGEVRSAINALGAWDMVTGSANIVVAVLDSGVLLNHPDLAGAVLPGYDMINVTPVANDGNARDNDATDPGDWVTQTEVNSNSTFRGCEVSDSSWHGTLVSGLIGGIANNGIGIAGTAHGVRILPVRVLGKCGGYDSDILAGMYWAAGVDQPGIPRNPNPARVLNMSLGGVGACEFAYVNAVETLRARNVVVVAAAGNSTGHAVGTPANCPGVIGVAGLRHAGSKVGFSDLGPEITISAPGGNCVNIGAGQPCVYPIVSSTNSAARSPSASGQTWSDSFKYSVGTSFSAPLVAGTVALMLSARPSLSNDQVIELLTRSARPFPTSGANNGNDDPTPVAACRAPTGVDQLQCYCAKGLCGAGMLDAQAAVQAIVAPSSPAEVARQLLNFGEANYPQLFPDRPQTQTTGPFIYRHYPSTGIYLGLVVQADPAYVLNGVYVVGGPFGLSPLLVGRLTDFITPVTTLSASSGSSANVGVSSRNAATTKQ